MVWYMRKDIFGTYIQGLPKFARVKYTIMGYKHFTRVGVYKHIAILGYC